MNAGAEAGGDRRGLKSAALKIWNDRQYASVDLRADWSDAPLQMLSTSCNRPVRPLTLTFLPRCQRATRRMKLLCLASRRMCTRVADGGLLANLSAGRRGRLTSSPPQLGQIPSNLLSAHAAQNVHSNEQIFASFASGGRSLSQHSQPGLSSSMTNYPLMNSGVSISEWSFWGRRRAETKILPRASLVNLLYASAKYA